MIYQDNKELIALKRLFSIVNGSTPKSNNSEYWDGDIPWVTPLDLGNDHNKFIETTTRKITQTGLDSCGTSLVPTGSIIMSCRAPIGSIGITSTEMCTNQGCKSLVKKSKNISEKFFYYVLLSSNAELNNLGKGTTFLELSTDSLSNYKVPNYSFEKQELIANFLDLKTAKIDNLIQQQEELVSLLTEKHKTAITHAITRGINSHAKLKDSGVKWIGKIPEHWNLISLKRLCELLKDGTHLPPARVDVGVPLLSVRNLQDSNFGFLEDDSQISEKSYLELSRSFVPQENDVLLAIVGATIGKTAMVPAGMSAFHIQRSLAIFRVNQHLTPSWLWRSFQSTGFQSLLWEHVGFSAQPGIYLGTLSEFKIPVPPLDEQQLILEKLNMELTKIKLLIDKSKRSIELLKEHRMSLISEAIAGKIDVKEAI